MARKTAAEARALLNKTFPGAQAKQLATLYDATHDAATTAVLGLVNKLPAHADNASTIPAAAPAGGTGATAGAYDTAANRDAAIATINGLRTAISDLKTEYNSLLAKLRTAGILT